MPHVHAVPSALSSLTSETSPMPTAHSSTAHALPLPETTTMQSIRSLKHRPTLTLVRSAPSHATAARPPRPPVEAEEPMLLRASQVDNVAAEEVEFFFTKGDTDSPTASARAVIASWIATLPQRDQDALALYYEPEPWPASILAEGLDYTRGYALVLANASAKTWRPHRKRRFSDEEAASEQLRACVFEHGPRALRQLTRRAEWAFATALRAYSTARGRSPSVLADLAIHPNPSEES